LIALSYGVKAVGLGRVTIAGLGAGGRPGLDRAFAILKTEFERAMRLVGVESVSELRERGAEIRRESGLIGDAHLPPIVF
ncbi:MAG: alpha-hydroxy-acid oxidizing protein, partial [Bacteroidota bacterium]